MKSRTLFAIATVALTAGLAGPATAEQAPPTDSPTLERIKATKAITLAVRDTANPFAFNNGKDQYIGYSVELCELVAKGIQASLRLPEMSINYVPVTGGERVEVVSKDYADMECSTTSITRARLAKVSFSVATFYSTSQLVGKTGSAVAKREDLAGKRVAVGEKTIQEKWLADLAASGVDVHVDSYKNPNDAFLAFMAGSDDFFATDDLLALSMLRGSQAAPGKASLMALKFLPNTYGIMVKNGDPGFKAAVDAQLRAAMASGAAREIYRKWFERPIPPSGKPMDWPMPKPLADLFEAPSDEALID
jgi:glutamate/aspartate transport system substrate-binding protein